MAEKQFVNGMRVSRRETAPSFVIASLGIKVDEFIAWLRANQSGEWTNIDIKRSREGKFYAELNTYNKADKIVARQEKEKDTNQAGVNNLGAIEYPTEDINPDDIPF